MTEGYSVDVRGFPELAAGTSQLAHNIDQGASENFRTVADHAATLTRGVLHRDTGRTAGSVFTRSRPQGAVIGMGEGVEYAQYEEYGGRGFPHSATGNFLYPSAMSVEPLLVAAAGKTAEQQIGAMHWPNP